MKLSNTLPKVLIGCPVSKRHEHLLDEWIEMLNKLSYPNFDVLLVDTTPNDDSYFKRLKEQEVNGRKINVIRFPWNYKKDHVVQMLAHAREKIRQYFLDKKYDSMFFLDDDIFIPEWSIQRLLSYNKDCVGFYVHIYREKDKRPCVLKNGEITMGGFGINLYTFDEINTYKDYVKRLRENKLTKKEKKLKDFLIKDEWHPQLFKTYGVNIGCLMIQRKVLEVVPFRTHSTFIYGEDLWFFSEANDKGFEFWCDTDTNPTHKNTPWEELIKMGPKQFGDFYIAMGPEKADKLVFLERKKDGSK